MKHIFQNLNNKAFDNRIRLGIMSMLMVNDAVEFGTVKELLSLSDGNLASHITVLEKENYILIRKEFVGKKPLTTYSATELGKSAFAEYLDALEALLKSTKQN